MKSIDGTQVLREIYPRPKERTLRKVVNRIDDYCARFIAIAPFCVLATVSPEEAKIDRAAFPTLGEILNAQTGDAAPVETQEEMARRVAPEL